jgi:hypothetical protein
MRTLLYILFGLFLLLSCKKTIHNPYNDLEYPDTTGNSGGATLDPTSIEGLHEAIFKPTCANSGCHDGTFEPDYRTIQSTYNNLVLHPVTKNTDDNAFEYRVKPFDAAKSMLHYRLTENLGGNSGIMPLVLEPGSDWPQKRQEHIGNIIKWINKGAPDMFGKIQLMANKEPSLDGVIAFANGSTSQLGRESANGPLVVPSGTTQLDIWFSISDDSTDVTQLTVNEVSLSVKYMNDFSMAKDTVLQLAASPLQSSGYYTGNYLYFHHIQFDPAVLNASGQYVFLRIRVKDPQHQATELPENGSPVKLKTYACLKIQ